SSDNPYTSFFGGPLSLAEGAARHDGSLPWHPWVGAAASLELLVEWQQAGALEEPVALARLQRRGRQREGGKRDRAAGRRTGDALGRARETQPSRTASAVSFATSSSAARSSAA